MTIKNRWSWLCAPFALFCIADSLADGRAGSLKDSPVAVSTIKAEDLDDAGMANLDDLVSRSPGLSYGYRSDPTPNIRIRGATSVTATQPLYVVDGVPLDGGMPDFDPSAIERIEVLRGNAAASIYGSRGSAGVIIVTTKSGDTDRSTGAEQMISTQGNAGCGANDGIPLPSALYPSSSGQPGTNDNFEGWQLPPIKLEPSIGYMGVPRDYLQNDGDRDTETGASEGARKIFTEGYGYSQGSSFGAVQQFPGITGDRRYSSTEAPDFEFDIDDDFSLRAGRGFNIGANYYLPYYGLNPDMNLEGLETVPGQGGVSNDSCTGTAAFTGHVLGASLAAISDEWAIGRVMSKAKGTSSGETIIVGVVDTGLDKDHLDFAPDSVWRNPGEIAANGIDDDGNGYIDDVYGWDFVAESSAPVDLDGHGTFVAGLIAATRGNKHGIDGVNPNARIMVLKALNSFGSGRSSDIAQAIAYGADNGARIINLSINPNYSGVVQDAVDYATSKGVLVITAAGNEAANLDAGKTAGLRNVMTIAATDKRDNRAPFSNQGSGISVAAPGIDVVSLRARRSDFMYKRAYSSYAPGDAFLGDDKRYYRANGTSFSAALTSGIASLVWSERPLLTNTQVRRIIEQSARDVGVPGKDRYTGYGVVNASAALKADPSFYIDAAILGVRQVEIAGQSHLQVVGTAQANRFARARLEFGQGETPSEWQPVDSAIAFPVALGKLVEIPLLDFIGHKTWTLRLLVDHEDGETREARFVVDLS